MLREETPEQIFHIKQPAFLKAKQQSIMMKFTPKMLPNDSTWHVEMNVEQVFARSRSRRFQLGKRLLPVLAWPCY